MLFEYALSIIGEKQVENSKKCKKFVIYLLKAYKSYLIMGITTAKYNFASNLRNLGHAQVNLGATLDFIDCKKYRRYVE